MSYTDYNAIKAGQSPSDSQIRKAKFAPYLAEIAKQLELRSPKSEWTANRRGFKFA